MSTPWDYTTTPPDHDTPPPLSTAGSSPFSLLPTPLLPGALNADTPAETPAETPIDASVSP